MEKNTVVKVTGNHEFKDHYGVVTDTHENEALVMLKTPEFEDGFAFIVTYFDNLEAINNVEASDLF